MRASRSSSRSPLRCTRGAGRQQRGVGAVGMAGRDDALAVQPRCQLAAQQLVEREAQVAHARHGFGLLRRALQPRHQLEGVADPQVAVAAHVLQVQAGITLAGPVAARGSCSRRASRRCRARTPPAAPACRRWRASGRYRRTGTRRCAGRVQPVVVEGAVAGAGRGRRYGGSRRVLRRAPARPAARRTAPAAAARCARRRRRRKEGRCRIGTVLQCMSAGPGAAPAAVGWAGRLRCSSALILSTASST